LLLKLLTEPPILLRQHIIVVEKVISNLMAGFIGDIIVKIEVVTRRSIWGRPLVLLTLGIAIRSVNVAFA
jgi:hypothetical protein